jgi:hypothetical protein
VGVATLGVSIFGIAIVELEINSVGRGFWATHEESAMLDATSNTVRYGK